MASEYARYVVNKRAKKAMEDPRKAYRYAYNVIKGRWCQAEPCIMKDPQSACLYALGVIKGRWPEAEDIIMKDELWWVSYKRNIPTR